MHQECLKSAKMCGWSKFDEIQADWKTHHLVYFGLTENQVCTVYEFLLQRLNIFVSVAEILSPGEFVQDSSECQRCFSCISYTEGVAKKALNEERQKIRANFPLETYSIKLRKCIKILIFLNHQLILLAFPLQTLEVFSKEIPVDTEDLLIR